MWEELEYYVKMYKFKPNHQEYIDCLAECMKKYKIRSGVQVNILGMEYSWGFDETTRKLYIRERISGL